MLVRDPPKRDPKKARDLKVKIPVSVHVHLHSLKIVTGKSISSVVTEALAEYFEDGRAFATPDQDEGPFVAGRAFTTPDQDEGPAFVAGNALSPPDADREPDSGGAAREDPKTATSPRRDPKGPSAQRDAA